MNTEHRPSKCDRPEDPVLKKDEEIDYYHCRSAFGMFFLSSIWPYIKNNSQADNLVCEVTDCHWHTRMRRYRERDLQREQDKQTEVAELEERLAEAKPQTVDELRAFMRTEAESFGKKHNLVKAVVFLMVDKGKGVEQITTNEATYIEGIGLCTVDGKKVSIDCVGWREGENQLT